MATVVIHTTEDTYEVINNNASREELLKDVVTALNEDGYYLIGPTDKDNIIYVPHHAVTAVYFHDS